MEESTKANGIITRDMEKESSNGLMAEFTLDVSWMMRGLDMEKCIIWMGVFTEENGLMINDMEEESSQMLMEFQDPVYGAKEF